MTGTERIDPPDALLEAAVACLRGGDMSGAAAALERAAGAQQHAHRDADAARSLQCAAWLRGASGDPGAARLLSARALAARPGDARTLAVAGLQEAESTLAQGQPARAARLYEEAARQADAAALGDDAAIAIARRLGACRIALGEFDAADAAFAAAARRADPRIAAFLATEHARLLSDIGAFARASRALPGLPAGDAQLDAEIGVELARLRRAAGDVDAAARAAAQARAHALEAVAPVPYFAGGVELAEAQAASGDRVAAYATLATTWATLSDVLGRDVARSWVEPCLLALRARWGEAAFDEARRAHDEARRRARSASGGEAR